MQEHGLINVGSVLYRINDSASISEEFGLGNSNYTKIPLRDAQCIFARMVYVDLYLIEVRISIPT